MGAVMEDERYFPDHKRFEPQRYIDDPSLNEKVMPFSLGKRQCLGESLARMELFLIFVTLLQTYK